MQWEDNKIEESSFGPHAFEGMPSSADEAAYMASVYKLNLSDEELGDEIREQVAREAYEGKRYYLDNCGGDEDHDAKWYCKRCDQEECGKRVMRRFTDEELRNEDGGWLWL